VFAFILNRRLNAVSVRAALSVALALSLVPTGTAQAELFWPHYRSWGWDDYGPVRPHHYRSWGWGDYEPFRQKRRRANKGYELEQKPKSQQVVKGPLQIIISIADQKISVYDDGALIARSSVSTGVQGHPTPLGVFSVVGKELWHRSNIYSAAPMPYMQRITWSGIALHAGVLPGHPASHGCIRLAKDFAIRLWHLTKRGTRVIICAQQCRSGPNSQPTPFFETENRIQLTGVFDRRPRGERRRYNPINSCRVSAKRSVARRHQRAAKKDSPDLSFCKPQIEQAFCASALYALV
jgi:L,D-transpeptidase catalytic domain